jgi:hypothetical protein
MFFAAGMQGWEVLIIPAIGFVVWLVSMMFRNANENKPKPPPPPAQRRPPLRDSIEPRRQTSADEPQRQTSDDLDRFIADTRRQRDAEERRGGRGVPANAPARPRRPAPVMLEEVVDEAPRRPAPRPPLPRPPPSPQRPLPRSVTLEAVPVLEVAEPVSFAPRMASLTQAGAPTMASLTEKALPNQPGIPVDMLERLGKVDSPLLVNLKFMLSSPQSAQLAFALREIFDEPLCRRKPRR